MRGYKAMNEDMTCRGFQYELGKTYEIDGDAKICESGFHFCRDIASVFRYYRKFDSRVFEVEAEGYIKQSGDKFCCPKITIIREVKGIELNRVIYGNGIGEGFGNGFGNGVGDGYTHTYDGTGLGNGFGSSDDLTDILYNDSVNGYGSSYGYGSGSINIQEILKYMED